MRVSQQKRHFFSPGIRVPLYDIDVLQAVAVLGFSFWGSTGVATLSSGGHTTNTFALNYRVIIAYIKL